VTTPAAVTSASVVSLELRGLLWPYSDSPAPAPFMSNVICLLSDPVCVERVCTAVRLVRQSGLLDRVLQVASWEDMLAEHERFPDAPVVFDPYWRGSLDASTIADLSDSLQSDAIAYRSFESRPVGTDIPLIVSAGINVIRTLDVDDQPESLASDLLQAIAYRELLEVAGGLVEGLSRQQQLVLRWAIRCGGRSLSVADLSAELGVSDRTLRRWFDKLDGVSVGRVLSWGRVIYASKILSMARAPAARVIDRLGFSSYSDFCKRFKTLTGEAVSTCGRDHLYTEAIHALREALGTGPK